jgi:RNA polymerase sigma factor (sigma-70 family)
VPTPKRTTLYKYLRRVNLRHDAGDLADALLLECWLTDGDDAAFEALVRRHGPMVLKVCRRVLHDAHEAEDVYQATFLVFVSKAASIIPRSNVGNWLHGVAYKAALRSRSAIARRRTAEREAADVVKTQDGPDDVWQQLQPVLDKELQALPETYRLPIVLCDLEGKTRKQASRQLGWAEGTVASRLARGRALLAQRLRRHGLPLSTAALATLLTQQSASAAVPTSLLVSTLKATALFAGGQGAARSMISEHITSLAKGMLRAMLLHKLSRLVAMVLLIGALAFGAGSVMVKTLAVEPKDAPRQAAQAPPKADLALSKLIKEAEEARRKDRPAKGGQGNAPTGPDKTAKEQYDAVRKEYETLEKENLAAMNKSKSLEEAKQIYENRPDRAAYAQKMLDIAEKYPKDAATFNALNWVIRLRGGDDTKEGVHALTLLSTYFIADPRIVEYFRGSALTYGKYGQECAASERLLREGLAKNEKNHDLQGWACFCLAQNLVAQGDAAAFRNKPAAAELFKEAEVLFERVLKDFADVKTDWAGGPSSLGERIPACLFGVRCLTVGKTAPDIEGEDLDGKTFKLSDYRGKVVLLAFWATWCPPCMHQLPHERALVKKFEGKPFAVIGVNGDENKKQLEKVMEKEQITWRNFWNDGHYGPITMKWNIDAWPTVFVIDHMGVIRKKHISPFMEDDLDELIEQLVKATEKQPELERIKGDLDAAEKQLEGLYAKANAEGDKRLVVEGFRSFMEKMAECAVAANVIAETNADDVAGKQVSQMPVTLSDTATPGCAKHLRILVEKAKNKNVRGIGRIFAAR